MLNRPAKRRFVPYVKELPRPILLDQEKEKHFRCKCSHEAIQSVIWPKITRSVVKASDALDAGVLGIGASQNTNTGFNFMLFWAISKKNTVFSKKF